MHIPQWSHLEPTPHRWLVRSVDSLFLGLFPQPCHHPSTQDYPGSDYPPELSHLYPSVIHRRFELLFRSKNFTLLKKTKYGTLSWKLVNCQSPCKEMGASDEPRPLSRSFPFTSISLATLAGLLGLKPPEQPPWLFLHFNEIGLVHGDKRERWQRRIFRIN